MLDRSHALTLLFIVGVCVIVVGAATMTNAAEQPGAITSQDLCL